MSTSRLDGGADPVWATPATHNTPAIDRVILFYSRHVQKSVDMKNAIDETAIDIDCVCVDPASVRETLLADEKYMVRDVPAVLVFYTTRRHKLYTKRALESWFAQMMANVRRALEPPPAPAVAEPVMNIATANSERGVVTKTTSKALPRKHASPGKPKAPQSPMPTVGVDDVATLTGDRSGIVAASEPYQTHESFGVEGGGGGSGDETTLVDDPPDYSGMSGGTGGGGRPRAIKAVGPSPSELAKQMAMQRDNWQKQEDDTKPFL